MYSIRSKGRFVTVKRYALETVLEGVRAVGLLNWTRIFFIAVFFAIYLIGTEPTTVEYVQAEFATSTPVVEEKPVIIELTYTKDRVKELIAEEFADAPIMMRVAACESGFLQHAYNPTNNSHDGGVFQISQKYHGEQMEKLGLDPYDVRDNIAYARILYDQNGLRDWSASKHCWNK